MQEIPGKQPGKVPHIDDVFRERSPDVDHRPERRRAADEREREPRRGSICLMEREADQDDRSGDAQRPESAETQGLSAEHTAGAVEAVLLTMDKPLSVGKLASAVGVDRALPEESVTEAVDALNAAYEETGRSFRIERVAGGYRIMTLGEFAPAIAAAHGMQASTRLSKAAIETLAIVAYRQPITRASVEAIRGVACGEVLRTLLEKKLITIAGRAEELGRPMLYGTTARFLEAFGLASIKDLPKVGDLFPGMDESALAEPAEGQPADATDVPEPAAASEEDTREQPADDGPGVETDAARASDSEEVDEAAPSARTAQGTA